MDTAKAEQFSRDVVEVSERSTTESDQILVNQNDNNDNNNNGSNSTTIVTDETNTSSTRIQGGDEQAEKHSLLSDVASTTVPGVVSIAGTSTANTTDEEVPASNPTTDESIERTTHTTIDQSAHPSVNMESSHGDVDETLRTALQSTRSNRLPVAEEYQELPVFPAERVTELTTVSAIPISYYNVDIDGDNSTHLNLNLNVEQAEAGAAKDMKDSTTTAPRRRRLMIFCSVGIAIALGVIALVVLLIAIDDDGTNSTTNENIFKYACYGSSIDIIEAQIRSPEDQPMSQPFIVCPNTIMRMGVFRNPSRNDFNITGGDYPFSVLRENVTIQCGIDGSRQNNCTMDGGLAHIVTQDRHYHPKYGFVEPTQTIDNLTVKGMTFTGQVQSAGVFGGVGIALSHPGKGIRFEDCAWIDLTLTKRLMTVGTNYFMELSGNSVPDMSIDVTLSNCLFENIVYEEELLVSTHQSFHIENSTFRNVALAVLLSAGCGLHPNGCRNILHCQSGGPSECSISDVCVENFDTFGAGPVVISEETDFTFSGVNLWYGPQEFDPKFSEPLNSGETNEGVPEFSPPAEGSFEPNEDIASFCALRVARYDAQDINYTCLEPKLFELGDPSGGCQG